MKFTVNRDALAGPLQLVAGVVERRQTHPILSNILFILSDNHLSLTGTDLEVEIIARLTVDNMAEAGEVTIPARKLLDICRSLPDDAPIEFDLTEEQRLIVKSGRSRFTLSTLPATDFPCIESVAGDLEFSCAQLVLKRLIDRTHFAMAQQDVRFYLNGMLWEIENNSIRCVATDGHRLAMCTAELDIQVPVKSQSILPRKGVVEFTRLLKEDSGKVTVNIGTHYVRLQNNDYTITSKLVDGKFPDYQRVLPKNGHNILLGDRNKLKSAFARTAILSNEKYRGVRLSLAENLLTLVANNPEQEEAKEEVVVEYTGDEIEIGFNINYLQDVSNVISSDSIKMSLSDSNSSALLEEPEGDDSVYVVMPMKL